MMMFCVCVRVRACARAGPTIHYAGFLISRFWILILILDQQDYQGTDQRCCVEDVYFLCQVPLSLLQNEALNLTFVTSHFILFTHQKQGKPRLNQCPSRFQNMGSSATFIRYHLWSVLHLNLICLWRQHSRKGSQSNQEMLTTNFSIESSPW